MGCDAPCETKPCEETYREPNPEELRSTNMKTPHVHERAIRINCPSGIVKQTVITFVDGEDLINVVRAVISLEIDQPCKIFITRFNNEIGKMVYETAECRIGGTNGEITDTETALPSP